MSYEKTVWAGEADARASRSITTTGATSGNHHQGVAGCLRGDGRPPLYDAAKANVDQYVTADGEILTYEPDKYNLDMICMGRTALRLFKATGEAKYEKRLPPPHRAD